MHVCPCMLHGSLVMAGGWYYDTGISCNVKSLFLPVDVRASAITTVMLQFRRLCMMLHVVLSEIHSVMHIAATCVCSRCATYQSSDGRWNKFGGRLAWDPSAICNNNPAWAGRGNHKTGDDYPAAPNIDHTQEKIRNDIIEWLKYLRNSIGFDGWRFDFVRGYNGQYAKIYIDATVSLGCNPVPCKS